VLFLDEPTSGLDPVAARDVHELIDELRQRGVTIFLTTHRLEEAERICDRVAILSTTLRMIGRPNELRERLFARALAARTVAPLPDPDRVFGGLPGVDSWRQDGPGEYVPSPTRPSPPRRSPVRWSRRAPTCSPSASRATRSRTSTSS
jgi:ABC-2 type transport system ATP-binding protein